MLDVTADDDTWHQPPSGDPFWTETLWFRFAVPERNLTGILYVIFRPNQRVASLFVYLWDRAGATEDNALYVHRGFHLPMPEDLRDVQLAGGFSYRCIEPLSSYEVRYDDGVELSIDLRYTGVHPPVAPGIEAVTSYFQPSRVTGTVRLNGTEADVDCYELRGSAWDVRPDLRSAPRPDDEQDAVGHADTYLADGRTTLFVRSVGDLGTTSVYGGFLMRDGALRRVVDGQRTVERSELGHPTSIRLEVTDETGRTLRATGRCVNQLRIPMPAYVMWSNGVQWDVEGEPVWGGDDEVPGGRPAHHLPPVPVAADAGGR